MFGYDSFKAIDSERIPSGYVYFVGRYNRQTRMYYRRYERRRK